MQLQRYQIPLVTDPHIESLRRRAGTAKVQMSYGGVPAAVSIIDAPGFGPGAQVNLAITEVDAMSGGVAYPIVQFTSDAIVNVLNYQTSALSLGTNQLPALAYDGVQYIVDPSQSSVVVNGQTFPMVFGTFGSHSFLPYDGTGLEPLYFPDPVNAATTAPNFVIDFNAAEWIDLRNGVAMVGPQGRGAIWSQSAVVAGSLVNAAGQPVSGAAIALFDASGALVHATLSGNDGSFQLHAMEAGSYSMVIYNSYSSPSGAFTLTASGNDPVGASIPGPSVAVPAGYMLQVGAIQD